jgi:hypothetical protein
VRCLAHGRAVTWSVFRNSETASALAGHLRITCNNSGSNAADPTFLDAVLGEPFLQRHRLNRSGRSYSTSNRQIRLPALVSECLDVAYLHGPPRCGVAAFCGGRPDGS